MSKTVMQLGINVLIMHATPEEESLVASLRHNLLKEENR